MAIGNRELSQFGSFIHIEDSTKSIGIATLSVPNVGIGTTNATHKLTVVGDTNVSGVVSATGYYLNQFPLVDAALQLWSPTGSDAYYSFGGNVGIGSTIPQEKLDIIGNVKATGTITGSNINLSGFSVAAGVVTAFQFHATVGTGTAPFVVSSQTLVTNLNADYLRGGIPGSNINTFDIVTNGATQTLTNKTLTLPTFGGGGVTFNGSTSGTTILKASSTAAGTLDLPATGGTLLSSNDTSIISSGMIVDGTIVNSDVSNSAAIVYSKLNLSGSITNADVAVGAAISVSKLSASTISGITLGGSLNNLTAGSFITYDSGSTYNGSAARTVSVAATTANTANTLVARNASGDFTAGTISCTNLSATTTVSANEVTATSDLSLKTNVKTIENSLDLVSKLRGVSFDWIKNNNESSLGVIAQELEKVLPELIVEGEYKSVNYNGLIGVLIEAVKELSNEVEELKKKINT